MTKFIENVNTYLAGRSIKQAFVSMQSGIDVKKLSRILTGVQDVTGTDMEKISHALGKNIEFFLQENFTVSSYPDIPYYPFHPSPDSIRKELKEFTLQVADLLLNADEILSAKPCAVLPVED